MARSARTRVVTTGAKTATAASNIPAGVTERNGDTADDHHELDKQESSVGETVARQLADAPSGIVIPGGIRRPRPDISRSTIWLYGEPKIGKTTLASHFPGVWFLATERGQDWVSVREPTLINSWLDFIDWCIFVRDHKPMRFGDGAEIRTIAIDTVDGLFAMCEEYVKAQLNVESLFDIAHGKGWNRLSNEWSNAMSKVARFPYGLILISHAREREIKTRTSKRDRTEPSIGASGWRWCQQAADLIVYAHAHDELKYADDGTIIGKAETRSLLCHPSSDAVAGGRMVGKLAIPRVIPLSYDALRHYFEELPESEVGGDE